MFLLRGNNLSSYPQKTHLTGVFFTLRITGANHSVCDIELFVFQPFIANLSLQYWHFNFVDSWLILGRYIKCCK